jgi:predicted O-methyltransferase YrrM
MAVEQIPALEPAAIPQQTPSAFRDLLAALSLSNVRRVLVVGAGAFAGATTTAHLLELFDTEVSAVEPSSEQASVLEEKFADRIKVVGGDVTKLDTEPYDLVVIDLALVRTPYIFEELLPDKVARLTAPGGIVVTSLVYDAGVAAEGPNAVPEGDATLIREFLLRRFGQLAVDDAEIKAAFASDPLYEVVGSVEKFRGDPDHFLRWVALQRSDAPADAARGEAPETEESARLRERNELLDAGEICALDLVGDPSRCGPECAGFVARWSDWGRSAFAGHDAAYEVLDDPAAVFAHRPDGLIGELVVPRVAMALIEVPEHFDEYLKAIGAKSRNMIRKATRNGFEHRRFNHDEHLEGIHEINVSKPVRSGGPMTASYTEFPRATGTHVLCDQHDDRYLGAFRDGRLRAYVQLIIVNELAVFNRFIGHGDDLKDGVMNGLTAFVLEYALGCRHLRAINYLTLHSSTEAQDRFKRSVGFVGKAGVLNVRPAAA